MTEDTTILAIKSVIQQLETAKTAGLIRGFGMSFQANGQSSFADSLPHIDLALTPEVTQRALYIEFYKDAPRDIVLNLREHFGTKYRWLATIMAVDMLKVELPRTYINNHTYETI